MEWKVNNLFVEEVTKISSSMLPPQFRGDLRATRAVQEQVSKIIDDLGKASALAQGLKKTITSAEKLYKNPTHVVYLMKDPRGQDGRGEVIGMIKVGRKHLFLFDDKEQVHEVEPLCVLDFYVVGPRQRMGYGRKLYDHMLQDLNTMAWEMAIDGPSPKMEQFLYRNYGFERLCYQNNNFAVAPNFFDRSDNDISVSALASTPAGSRSPSAVGRYTAHKPTSSIGDVIHGGAGADRSPCSPWPEGAAAAGPGVATVEKAAAEETDREAARPPQSGRCEFPNFYDFNELEDDWLEPETQLDDEAYEQFDPDRPAFERRDEMRALGTYRYRHERPATLRVRTDDEAVAPRANVPTAGMPSGEKSAAGMPSTTSMPLSIQSGAHSPFGMRSYAQTVAGTGSGKQSGAHTAAGIRLGPTPAAGITPAGRRDSQRTFGGFYDAKFYHNKLW